MPQFLGPEECIFLSPSSIPATLPLLPPIAPNQVSMDGVIKSFVMGGGGRGVAARAGGLCSFVHLSGPSRAINFLYAPAPPPPTVWALNLPRGLLYIKPPMHL